MLLDRGYGKSIQGAVIAHKNLDHNSGANATITRSMTPRDAQLAYQKILEEAHDEAMGLKVIDADYESVDE
jgi:hypothetical protein